LRFCALIAGFLKMAMGIYARAAVAA
jgi:hypothetical protein